MAQYQAGDKVKVLSGGFTSGSEAGLDATVVRAMPEADDYEVEYATEQPGVSPFVHPDRLRLVERAASESAPEAAQASEGNEGEPQA